MDSEAQAIDHHDLRHLHRHARQHFQRAQLFRLRKRGFVRLHDGRKRRNRAHAVCAGRRPGGEGRQARAAVRRRNGEGRICGHRERRAGGGGRRGSLRRAAGAAGGLHQHEGHDARGRIRHFGRIRRTGVSGHVHGAGKDVRFHHHPHQPPVPVVGLRGVLHGHRVGGGDGRRAAGHAGLRAHSPRGGHGRGASEDGRAQL